MTEEVGATWPSRPLGDLFQLHRESVRPASWPGELFEHFSIPAYDEMHGPAIEPGRAIESNKTLLSRPTILVSKLNPRIRRVLLAGC